MIEHLKHFPKQFMWKPEQFAACLAPPLPYLAACLHKYGTILEV